MIQKLKKKNKIKLKNKQTNKETKEKKKRKKNISDVERVPSTRTLEQMKPSH